MKTGIQVVRGFLSRKERRKNVVEVCHVNRVIYHVTRTVGEDTHLWIWPPVDIGENKIDPLSDTRVTKVLVEQGMEHCCVTPWSFGQEGEEWHKLKEPTGIATNSSGEFFVADGENLKMFESSGKFVKHIILPFDVTVTVNAKLRICDVALDMSDNIFKLSQLEKPGTEKSLWVLYKLS